MFFIFSLSHEFEFIPNLDQGSTQPSFVSCVEKSVSKFGILAASIGLIIGKTNQIRIRNQIIIGYNLFLSKYTIMVFIKSKIGYSAIKFTTDTNKSSI